MNLSDLQEEAKESVLDWLEHRRDQKVFRLFGYAGTGKTTIAKSIAAAVEEKHGRVIFGAYTGKAASVLRAKGCPGARTIHSITYEMVDEVDGKPIFEFTRKNLGGKAGLALIIIDECSMVGQTMGEDLLRHGVPILVLGDPAQLPPIGDSGYFTNCEPDVLLTEIHRQEAGSGVLEMATLVRMGGRLSSGDYGESCAIKLPSRRLKSWSDVDQILCGTNAKRRILNSVAREDLGLRGEFPMVGDRVVCLRNDHQLGVMNGETGMVLSVEDSISPALIHLCIDFDGHVVETHAPRWPFTDPDRKGERTMSRQLVLDFGWAITVHKAQGSQWRRVLLWNESHVFRDDAKRWLYTGITRAAESIIVAS